MAPGQTVVMPSAGKVTSGVTSDSCWLTEKKEDAHSAYAPRGVQANFALYPGVIDMIYL